MTTQQLEFKAEGIDRLNSLVFRDGYLPEKPRRRKKAEWVLRGIIAEVAEYMDRIHATSSMVHITLKKGNGGLRVNLKDIPENNRDTYFREEPYYDAALKKLGLELDIS